MYQTYAGRLRKLVKLRDIRNWKRKKSSEENEKKRCVRPNESHEVVILAVSYTHLDVYKRQGLLTLT